MTRYWLRNDKVDLGNHNFLAKGGEADIFKIDDNEVAKIFKTHEHPDLAGDKTGQDAATKRLGYMADKLAHFPKGLPPQMVAPGDSVFCTSPKREFAGYAMPFVKLGEVFYLLSQRGYVEANKIERKDVIDYLRQLHAVVDGAHNKGVVFGDFNDLNVLFGEGKINVVDCDSMQFQVGNKTYYCMTYTDKFLDPLHSPKDEIRLTKPHDANSDWYAFAVMMMQSLLYVGPYGGIYRPDKPDGITQPKRMLHGITVWHPKVRYPKPAEPLASLPKHLDDYFQGIFVKGLRGRMDASILTLMTPTLAPKAIVTLTVRGKVTATKILDLGKNLITVHVDRGNLRYLAAHPERDTYIREGGQMKLIYAPSPPRFRISGQRTVIGWDSEFGIWQNGTRIAHHSCDTYANRPMFDANSTHAIWVRHGTLFRERVVLGQDAPEVIGSVLTNNTMFWVGDEMAIGYYQAAGFIQPFMFNPNRGGINDSFKLLDFPRGASIIDGSAVFHGTTAWLFLTLKNGPAIENWCWYFPAGGTGARSVSHCVKGDGSWLSDIRGKVALPVGLLSSTDDGIKRINFDQQVEKEFPDTEPFVEEGTALHLIKEGLVAVNGGVMTRIELG